MKAPHRFVLSLAILVLWMLSFPTESRAEFSCGDIITEDTILNQDLECPPGILFALNIGGSDITLDLGGYTISGYAPGTGILATDRNGITIRNGVIDGFNDGIFLINSNNATIENLTVRNLDIFDPDHLIMGLHIGSSQDVIIRDILFEFPSVAHKEAIDLFDSDAVISEIEVRGGGAGVNFSFAGACDPVNSPSNGIVRNSRFSDIYIAGIEIACSSFAWIEGNDFSTAPGVGIGIQGDAPFMGDVTGVTIKNNVIHDTMIGIELRGILDSTVSDNLIFDNPIWGIAMRESLGCISPESGWECFYSTANLIADNETWGNGTDLYHYEESTGNTWEQNTCQTRQGVDIPECLPPSAALTINYASGMPGSFFTLEGANFPANSTATITINNHTLGSVPTDDMGNLVFLLNTDQADEGPYLITATVNPESSVSFILDSRKFFRPQEGQGTIFIVPAGLIPHFVSLPLILR